MELAVGIILLVFSVFLVIAVLMQSGKSHNLSGAIAGGAETFFGKEKGKTIDKVLSKVTTVVAIVFVLLVIILYMVNHEKKVDYDDKFNELINTPETTAAETTSAPETTAPAETTASAESTADPAA